MRIWRGLRTRIVIGSVLCGILGLLVSWAMIRRTARESAETQLAPYLRRTFDGAALSRCSAAPERWSLELPHELRIDAYDAATLTSRNPAAPALDRDLYRRLSSGEANPAKVSRGGEHAAALLLRIAPDGPCALLQATWTPRMFRRRRLFYLMLLGAVIVTAAAAALGVFFVVQPLTRRIARLRAAAADVGHVDAYRSAADLAPDELGELSVGLDRAHARIRADAEQLEERHRALEHHLAEIAHDLKTPIASLQIALEQASKLAKDEDSSSLLRGALDDVVYIGALTTNLRLACQLRDGWSPAEGRPSTDIGETIERVVGRARFFAKNRKIVLEVARPDGPVLVRCDPTAAEQAVANLVENAIGYGDEGGHVAVVLEPDRAAGTFVLTVADDGPGVLPAELPRLGERTFRTDEARQREPSGSGLGLAITGEICQRCGFTLSFDAERPRGLKVTLSGPILSDA